MNRFMEKNHKDLAWNAWKTFFASGFGGQKMVYLPEGTSAEIVKVYGDAFDKVHNSDEFAKVLVKTVLENILSSSRKRCSISSSKSCVYN
jgi:hypothetical protein